MYLNNVILLVFLLQPIVICFFLEFVSFISFAKVCDCYFCIVTSIADTLNAETNGSLSEQIQVAILGNEHLSQVFYKVQTEFSYNTGEYGRFFVYFCSDSIANATFNNKSLSSHVKYPMLVNEIENFSKSGKQLF